MASQADPKELNVQEQLASIRRHMAEIDQRQEEISRIRAETKKAETEVSLMKPNTIFQAMIATGALLGAGAAIAKVFFP